MTTETQILAAATTAGNSSDVVLELGESCTVCAYASADFTDDFSAQIKYKIGSTYFTAAAGANSGGVQGVPNSHRMGRNQTILKIDGPLTFRVEKAASTQAVGFYAVT
jgi:hypothetical protein